MSRPPLIGITSDSSDEHPGRYETPADYAGSVERAGGLPVMLPYHVSPKLAPSYVEALDGLLLSGGNDLDPAAFGETYHPRAEPIDPARAEFERALLAEAERRRMPILGICLGSQLMNVHRGGSLVQFLPDEPRAAGLEHRSLDDRSRRHAVTIEPGTVLADAVGAREIQVNTRHKQAVRRLGRGLRINALASDGVVEGVEDPTMPLFLAVQWHPENLTAQPEHLALFKLLVEKSSARSR